MSARKEDQPTHGRESEWNCDGSAETEEQGVGSLEDHVEGKGAVNAVEHLIEQFMLENPDVVVDGGSFEYDVCEVDAMVRVPATTDEKGWAAVKPTMRTLQCAKTGVILTLELSSTT